MILRYAICVPQKVRKIYIVIKFKGTSISSFETDRSSAPYSFSLPLISDSTRKQSNGIRYWLHADILIKVVVKKLPRTLQKKKKRKVLEGGMYGNLASKLVLCFVSRSVHATFFQKNAWVLRSIKYALNI